MLKYGQNRRWREWGVGLAAVLVALFLLIVTQQIVFSSMRQDYESSSSYRHDLAMSLAVHAAQAIAEPNNPSSWFERSQDGGVPLATVSQIRLTFQGNGEVLDPAGGAGEELMTGGDISSDEDAPSEGGEEKVTISDLRLTEYKVRPGETLASIASKHGRRLTTLVGFNQLSNPNVLKVGQKISIPNQEGVLHVVGSNEALSTIAGAYKIPLKDIIEANKIENPAFIKKGQKLFLPGAEPIAGKGRGEVPWIWPLRGRLVSSYGMRMHPIYHRRMMHQGLDIVGRPQASILCAKPGRVIRAGWYGGYGRCVDVRHSGGIVTRYGHLSSINVRVGQKISQGQVIGRMGATGNVTGAHLHFEIRVNGKTVNPKVYLPR